MKRSSIEQLSRNLSAVREQLFETIIYDIQDQLEILDPVDDSEEFMSRLFATIDTPEGAQFIAFILGVPDHELDTWLANVAGTDED